MKRLLEWKQRMLQSPLTRKSGSGGGARSGSERSTPTMVVGHNNSSTDREASSPRLQSRFTNSPDQSAPSKLAVTRLFFSLVGHADAFFFVCSTLHTLSSSPCPSFPTKRPHNTSLSVE